MKKNEIYFIYEYIWSDISGDYIYVYLGERILDNLYIDIYNFTSGILFRQNRYHFSFSDMDVCDMYKFITYVDTDNIEEIKNQYPEYFI